MRKTRNGLVEEHAEPVHRPVTPLPSSAEKLRFERHVNEIGHDGGPRQAIEGKIESRLAGHAEGCALDEESRTGEGFRPLFPGGDPHLRPTRPFEFPSKRLGPVDGPVQQGEGARPGAGEGEGYATGRTARA
jgi:hypothetical protein